MAPAAVLAGSAIYSAIQSRKAGKKIDKQASYNKGIADQGIRLADEGVGAFRKLGDQYEQRLSGGGSVLPGSTLSVLKRARGLTADRNVRDTMASAARLRQARRASGGRLSAEAAQEYLTEAEAEANRAAHEANLGIDTEEARLELTETNSLMDRLERARAQVLGAGQSRLSMGLGGSNSLVGGSASNDMQLAQILAGLAGAYAGRPASTTPRLGTDPGAMGG